MAGPWNFTEAQRRQFREAQAEAKQDRPPAKRWQVRTPTSCEDRRSQKGAYELALGLANALLSSEVWHWEDGSWRLYERVEPAPEGD